MKYWINKVVNFKISIKTLTLLGFSLVAMPLVLAFLYSANQVNNLSHQGTTAIFNVAQLVESNRKVSQAQARLERFAGQYVVLQDLDLIQQFNEHLGMLTRTLNQEFTQGDHELKQHITSYKQKLLSIHNALSDENTTLTLQQIQTEFRQLGQINQLITLRSNHLVSHQAEEMMQSAEQIKETMLFSLYTIPLTFLIAGIFTILITRPLRSLQAKIGDLESGNLQQSITIRGSAEVVEIAEALDVMRRRLHELELQKSSFIRHISHELKTPLAAIREGTELIYDNSVGQLNQDQREITNIIRTSVSKLQTLIEDLLDFNIVLDSTSLHDAQLINLKDEIDQGLTLRQLDISRKELKIIKQIDDISILCNRKQFGVILDNLLSNAIKFSPDHGSITLTAAIEYTASNHAVLEANKHLKLSIKDQGPGIPSAAFDDIFNAFYQGSIQHNSPIKSSGLGLTIVKELLLRMSGTITINSSTETPSYTQFTVVLPKASLLPKANNIQREIARHE